MSCSSICRSIIAICSGGMVWLRAAAWALSADDLVVQLAAGDFDALAFGHDGVSEQARRV